MASLPLVGAPSANAIPLPGGVSDAVFNAGDSRKYEDEWAPGWINWTNGLYVALSTDPTQYVAPTAGNLIRVDAKIGN